MVLHYQLTFLQKNREKNIKYLLLNLPWLPTALQLKNTNLLRKHDKDQPKHPNVLSPTLTGSSTGGGRDYKSYWCQQKVKQIEIQSAFREPERNVGLEVHLDRSLEGGKISTPLISWQVKGQWSQNLRWDLCLTMYL